jgi:hypothetical protein
MAMKRKAPGKQTKRKSGAKAASGKPRSKRAARISAEQNNKQLSLRRHLLNLLKGESAHAGFDSAFADLPVAKSGSRPAGAPHSAWQLLEHMRIAQWDILGFSRDPNHVSPKWPEGYWPDRESPPTEKAWAESVKAFQRDLKAMQDLVSDSSIDLFARIPHGDGQTIVREALLLADHNSYHLGQLVLVRRVVGEWAE